MTSATASLADYLESSAARHAGRTAIVDAAGWSLTYGELNDRADRLAGFLLSAGVQPGDRVGVILPKGADAITAFFAIMKARAAYVPVDYTAPASRARTILADCDVRVAFVASGSELLDGTWLKDGRAATLVVVGTGSRPGGAPAARLVPWAAALRSGPATVDGRSRSDLAYILYTSGSTGIPKGVMLTHENALSFVDWCSDVFAPDEADRFSSHAPFHFDLSVLDIYVALKHGAAVYVIPEELGKTPKELAAFIADNRLTIWYSTPSILSLLVQFGSLDARDFRALRLVLFAGEVFPVKHLRRLVSLVPSPAYYNLYGPTETNVCTFARIPTPIPEDRTAPYPIGFPCAHCDACALEENGEEVRDGEGLLYIAGPSVFPGYWNRPDRNATVFVTRAGRRWYNTGDVVRFEPGQGFVYLGRRDRMVKRRGYRIELGEIERALYQHPAVAEAAVIAVPDEAAGTRLVAYLSARTTDRPSIVALKMFCTERLPSYMSPDAFVFLDALPRTSTDKVNYQRLSTAAAAGAQASTLGA